MTTTNSTLRKIGSSVRSRARRPRLVGVEAVIGCVQPPVERGPQRVQAEIGHQQDQDASTAPRSSRAPGVPSAARLVTSMPQIRSRTRPATTRTTLRITRAGTGAGCGRAGGGTGVGDVLDDLPDGPQHRHGGKQQEQRAGETAGPQAPQQPDRRQVGREGDRQEIVDAPRRLGGGRLLGGGAVVPDMRHRPPQAEQSQEQSQQAEAGGHDVDTCGRSVQRLEQLGQQPAADGHRGQAAEPGIGEPGGVVLQRQQAALRVGRGDHDLGRGPSGPGQDDHRQHGEHDHLQQRRPVEHREGADAAGGERHDAAGRQQQAHPQCREPAFRAGRRPLEHPPAGPTGAALERIFEQEATGREDRHQQGRPEKASVLQLGTDARQDQGHVIRQPRCRAQQHGTALAQLGHAEGQLVLQWWRAPRPCGF